MILGVLAAVYGIVLAFVIVALYEEYRQAGNDVRTEATALSKVYRDSQAFAPPGAVLVKTAVGNYIRVVVNDEWPKMKHGQESEQGWRNLAAIYAALRSQKPKTIVQTTFYTEAVARVNDGHLYERVELLDRGVGSNGQRCSCLRSRSSLQPGTRASTSCWRFRSPSCSASTSCLRSCSTIRSPGRLPCRVSRSPRARSPISSTFSTPFGTKPLTCCRKAGPACSS